MHTLFKKVAAVTTFVLVATSSSASVFFAEPLVTAQSSRSELLAQKQKAEGLIARIDGVDKEFEAALEAEVKKQVDTGPKGEYETTAQYQARQGRAKQVRAELTATFDRERANRKQQLQKGLSAILANPFMVNIDLELGTYDADNQTFPLVVPSLNYSDTLYVPLAEAQRLKEQFSSAIGTAVVRLYVHQELTVEAADREMRIANATPMREREVRLRENLQIQEYIQRVQVSFGPRVYTSKGLQPDAATALRLLYGNYDADKKHSTVLTSVLPDYFVGLLGDSGPLYATAQFSSPFRENDRNKRVILTRVAPEEFECHVCAPVVGAVLFAQVNDGWEIQTASPILGRYSSSGFGQAPKATILKIGPDKMSIVLSQGYMAMGEGGTANLYLAQVDNRIEEVLEVETYGVNDEEVFNTRIQYVPGANPEYFDVKVIFIGKRKTKRSRQSVMVPFTEVKSFRFSNAKYRPA